MQPQARLAIEAECIRLINHYATLTDAGRWQEVADLYIEDGRFCRPTAPDAPIVGREAIRTAFLARPPRVTRHVTANIVITVESPSEARAFSVILLFSGTASADGLPLLDPGAPLVGSFQDRLALTDQGWRFAERRGALDFRRE